MDRKTYGGGSGVSEMNDGYIGFAPVPVGADILNGLIDSCLKDNGLLFLQWPHQVKMLSSGQRAEVDLDCTEGRVFNQSQELRWKRVKDGYEVLLLSGAGDKAPSNSETLSSLGSGWKVQVVDAKPYLPTETRLPRSLKMPEGFDLQQRYFMDAETGCVQFVTLRATKHGSK